MDWVSLIISLASGAAGGNILGAFLKDKQAMGALANTLSGIVGGGASGIILQLLGFLGTTTGAAPGLAPEAAADMANIDIAQLLSNIGVSGGAGALVSYIVSLIKKAT